MGARYTETSLTITNGSDKLVEAFSVPEGKTYTVQAIGFQCDDTALLKAKINDTIVFEGISVIKTQWGNFYPFAEAIKGPATLKVGGKKEDPGTSTLHCMIYYFEE